MQSMIQKLKGEGAIKCYLDFRAGHTKDLSGNGKDGTLYTGAYLTNNGVKGEVRVADDASLRITDGTVLVLFAKHKGDNDYIKAGTSALVMKDSGVNSMRLINYKVPETFTKDMAYNDGATEAYVTPWITFVGKRCMAFTRSDTNFYEAYYDGQRMGLSNAVKIFLMNWNTGVWRINPETQNYNTCEAFMIINRRLTVDEHAKLYAELVALKFQKNPQINFNASASSYLPRREALVFEPSVLKDGVIINKVNGAKATITGKFQSKKTKYGDIIYNTSTVTGSHSITFPDDPSYTFADNIFSVSFWMKPFDTASKSIIAKQSGSVYEWSLGASDGSGQLWSKAWIPNATASVYTANAYYPFTVNQMEMWTMTADGSNMYTYRNKTLVMTQARVGTNTMADTAATLSMIGGYQLAGTNSNAEVKINGVWKCALTADDIAQMYNKQAPLFKTDYGTRETIATAAATKNLGGSPFNADSAQIKISDTTIGGKLVKVIEATGNGSQVSIPTSYFLQNQTEAAYGIWEWNYYVGAVDNQSYMEFVQNGTDYAGTSNLSISTKVNGSDSLGLVIAAIGTLNASAAGAYPRNAWYKIRVERTATGIITVYVNDVLLNVTGGTGTNPITNNTTKTATHIIFYMMQGDKLILSCSCSQMGLTKK